MNATAGVARGGGGGVGGVSRTFFFLLFPSLFVSLPSFFYTAAGSFTTIFKSLFDGLVFAIINFSPTSFFTFLLYPTGAILKLHPSMLADYRCPFIYGLGSSEVRPLASKNHDQKSESEKYCLFFAIYGTRGQ